MITFYKYFSIVTAAALALLIIAAVATGNKPIALVKEDKKRDAVSALYDCIERFWLVFLTGIFAVFLVTRLFHLGIAPTGIHVDEAGMAYDAYCLAVQGTDRYGHAWPIYLPNYGGGQSVLYAYLMSILYRFCHFTLRNIRLVAVGVAVPAFFAMFGLGTMLDDKRPKLSGLISSFLWTVTPYCLMSERWALDCNLFLSVAAIAMFLFVLATVRNRIGWFVIAGAAWGLCFYTYAIAYVTIPLFLILAAGYLVSIKGIRASGKNIISFAIPAMIMLIPLALEQLVNLGMLEPFSLLESDFFVYSESRASEFALANVPANLGFLSKQLVFGDELTYNALPGFGAFIWCLLPFAIYGLIVSAVDTVRSIGRKTVKQSTFVLFFFVSAYLIALTVYKPNLNRVNEIFLPMILFVIIGLGDILKRSIFHKEAGTRIIHCGSMVATIVSFVCFGWFYFTQMNDVYGCQLLFYPVEMSDAIRVANDVIDPSHTKHTYLELEYDDLTSADLSIATVGDVSQSDWLAYHNGETGNTLGRFEMHFPAEFNPDEDAIYIMGRSWNHISDYLISIGFNVDDSFEHYRILWK